MTELLDQAEALLAEDQSLEAAARADVQKDIESVRAQIEKSAPNGPAIQAILAGLAGVASIADIVEKLRAIF